MAHRKCDTLRNSNGRNILVLQQICGLGPNLAAMAESKAAGADSDSEEKTRYSPRRVMAAVTFKGQA